MQLLLLFDQVGRFRHHRSVRYKFEVLEVGPGVSHICVQRRLVYSLILELLLVMKELLQNLKFALIALSEVLSRYKSGLLEHIVQNRHVALFIMGNLRRLLVLRGFR